MTLKEICDELTSAVCDQINKGLSYVDTNEMGKVIDMIKDLADANYHMTLTEAMEKSGYELTTEAYKAYSPDVLRSVDKANGVMYYTEMDHSEVGRARREYMDNRTMETLDNFLTTLSEDLGEMAEDMDNSQKTMLRAKMQTLIQRI